MLAYHVTEADLRNAAERASKLYDGNVVLDVRGMNGRAIRFGLKVSSSRGNGAHRSWQGRRTTYACWHVHAEFFRALFESFPDARIKSAMADYRGRESFEKLYELTGMRNVGPRVQPCQAREACECARWWL